MHGWVCEAQPRIFRQALDRLDVTSAEAVFVGDKLDVNVAGPQKLGMRAVLVETPFRREDSPDIKPDARIASIDDLLDLLTAWDQSVDSQMPLL